MLHTNFFNKIQYLRNFVGIFYFTELNRSNTYPVRQNSGDTLHCSLCRTVESNPNEGEEEGEEQRRGRVMQVSSEGEGEGEGQRREGEEQCM